MKKIREVVRLRLSRGAGIRQIAAACNIGKTTASEYVARIEAAGLIWPSAGDLGEPELVARLAQSPSAEAPSGGSMPMPEWSEVRRQLALKGVTLKLLWLEYREAHPDGYSYSRYARLYRKWRVASDLVMLQHHKAGEKMFVDWAGLKVRIVEPKTGEIRATSVFVAAVGASQFTFAKAYESEQLRSWLNAHVDALEFFGAVPELVVPDNTKTGVEKACRYEPLLNLSYADFARFYDIAVVPTRVRKPKDKAKVENAVQQVERWVLAPLRDRTFFSVDEANEEIGRLVDGLNDKVKTGIGLSRKQLFDEEDRPAMRPLPADRYHYADWKPRVKVGPDYHIEAEGQLYSVPFTLCGQYVDVRISLETVEVFVKENRVAAHRRAISRRPPTTDASHMPEGHRQHAEWTPSRVVRWAQTLGPNTAAFAEALMKTRAHPEQGFRACLGVIRLEKRFGKERLDAACAKALSAGAYSYHSVKSLLEKNLESAAPTLDLGPLPTHDNIRGGGYYAEEPKCAN
ncbi:MAG: IS21 family transposase [Steroidobacteraceae bacterium]